jgi:leader peptidase (prepilin peptidase)/N-methyltransferase
MWLDALSGSLFGLLIGGGVVWLVRLLGSVAFGKEALGLGDVHLMAGVGACLGWIDATLAFFGSAFVGLAITLVSSIAKGKTNRAHPLGPSLAIATVGVLLGKVFIERAIGILAPALAPVHLP